MSEKNLLDARRKVVVDNEKKDEGGRLKRGLRIAAFLLLLSGLIGGGLGIALIIHFKSGLPSFESADEYRPLLGTIMYAEDETKISEFAIEKRLIVSYDQLPRLLILAFIAAEDEDFFYHFGIDPKGILRAFIRNVKAGRIVEGASTITMQTARTFFLTREKSYIRKIKEVILSVFELEPNLTKEEILWLYLNQIYLGHGAYGVQQASLRYYGKNVWDLELEEMAVLAGLPKAPGRDSPFINPAGAAKRKAYVLRRMLDEGYISREEHDEALAKPIRLAETTDLFLDYAPHFAEHVRKYLYERYGEDALYTGGMQVYTTLKLDAQKYAQDALHYGLRNLDRRQGYRGAPAHIPKAKWDEFLGTLKEHYKDRPLRRNEFVYGLVTAVDDRKKECRVRVGDVEAALPLSAMVWARKPNPEVYYEWVPLQRPSQALKAGDVVMVRPTDPKGLEDSKDFRSTKPLDMDKLVWDLEQEPKAQAALLSKDPDSGYTIAMVGGYSFERSEFNRAIQACRQPGSAFKPIVYTAALEKGWHVSTIILDSPIVDGEWKEKWKPENYGEDFKGEVSMRYALQHSVNIPAIRTLDFVGIPAIRELAKRLGIRTEIQEDRSISLGSACVTPEDLVNVYAHYPLLGLEPRTVYVKTVIDRDGNILEDNRIYYDVTLDVAEKLAKLEEEALTHRKQVLSPTTAYIMTWLMTEVVNGGTASAARALGRPVGGKTGTTNDSYDAWFAGFTPHLSTAAWIGHDDNSRPLGKLETGGRAALPIWLDFMQRTLEGAPVVDFVEPPGIHWLFVDSKTGRKAIKGTPHVVKAPFKWNTAPEETMPSEGEVAPDDLYKMGGFY